jgi:hypothetical protein
MPGYETPAERYRRRAQECLTVANTLSPGDQRDVILQMAQEWLRLAHEHSGATWPFSQSSVGEQATMQQQQQIRRPRSETRTDLWSLRRMER